MEEGLRFAIREGGRTVGAGVVAKIIRRHGQALHAARAPMATRMPDQLELRHKRLMDILNPTGGRAMKLELPAGVRRSS
jgi:hypothetical protein